MDSRKISQTATNLLLTVSCALGDNFAVLSLPWGIGVMSGKKAKPLRAAEKGTVESPKYGNSRPASVLLAFVLSVVFAAGGFFVYWKADRVTFRPLAPLPRTPGTLDHLLAMPPDRLAQVDIAEMNLLCATGLPGAEDMDIDRCLARLDQWAARVKYETERHLYRLTDPRYKDHAEHYRHSEARFRAEWLVGVLQQDIGAHYHAGFVPQDQDCPPFKTPKETFLHGLLDHEDARKAFGGNCVSLPVLYAAVGRRLGYPIKLVCAKEHVFCRWEGLDSPNPAWRDRFNFDGAGNGSASTRTSFISRGRERARRTRWNCAAGSRA